MANKSRVKLLTLSRQAATKAFPSASRDFRLESVCLSAANKRNDTRTHTGTAARREIVLVLY